LFHRITPITDENVVMIPKDSGRINRPLDAAEKRWASARPGFLSLLSELQEQVRAELHVVHDFKTLASPDQLQGHCNGVYVKPG
jgi:hypothetical protein